MKICEQLKKTLKFHGVVEFISILQKKKEKFKISSILHFSHFYPAVPTFCHNISQTKIFEIIFLKFISNLEQSRIAHVDHKTLKFYHLVGFV